MSWATTHIARLLKGETVKFRPRGGSMAGKIRSGQLCTIVPITADKVQKDDIVLCTVHGSPYLHLVKAVQGGRCLIGNNRGGTNGWTKSVYGRCISIEP